MKHVIKEFTEDLGRAHGDNLVSVILYGPAAAKGSAEYGQRCDLLVALKKISPEDLRNAHACMREWTKTGQPVPVYFTEGELERGGDVFPIEFHFMRQARIVLFGKDVLEGLSISDKNLRHQTEFELRSKLIRLRRKYIRASATARELYDLMSASLESFTGIFRAVLLLVDANPPADGDQIIEEVVNRLGIDTGVFDKILAIGENVDHGPDDVIPANELFAGYLKQIEKIITAVDSM